MADLNILARTIGMYESYTTIDGQYMPLDSAARDAILRAMGFDIDDTHDASYLINTFIDSQRLQLLAPFYTVQCHGQNPLITLTIPAQLLSAVVAFKLLSNESVTDTDDVLMGEVILAECETELQHEWHGTEYYTVKLPLPQLSMGYWQLSLTINQQQYHCEIAAVPEACMGHLSNQSNKVWGLATQLYSLRSDNDWGIGSFSELKQLITLSAQQGCDSIGINPIHPLYWSAPEHCSPYSPSTRCFINPIYLDIQNVIGFNNHQQVQQLANSEQVKQLRQKTEVDYVAVTRLKNEALTLLFEQFEQHSNDRERTKFQDFCQQHGQTLQQFAVYNALFETFQTQQQYFGWQQWPAEYQDPASQTVADFAVTHSQRIRYFQFIQWQAHEQLNTAQNSALEAGMSIGLYLDLAVGCHDAGSEVWAQQDDFVLGASIGAPPDAMSAMGQSWGLPPVDPQKMKAKAYQQFRDILRFNMRYAGAIRIDHILGYMRQFWIAPGMSATDGVYMGYPVDTLFSIIALESHLNQCIVVGEDLGTVPDGFTDKLRQYGILSYKVMLFERWQSGLFKQPDTYPEAAMVTASTHDLPTIRGWWQGNDLMWREALQLYPDQEVMNREQQARVDDRQMLLDALLYEGVLCQTNAPSQTPATINLPFNLAVQSFLSQSASRIQMITLEDLLCLKEQVNIPGTVDQHPNWRRKLPVTVTEIWQQQHSVDIANSVSIHRNEKR